MGPCRAGAAINGPALRHVDGECLLGWINPLHEGRNARVVCWRGHGLPVKEVLANAIVRIAKKLATGHGILLREALEKEEIQMKRRARWVGNFVLSDSRCQGDVPPCSKPLQSLL